jgi:hypothetical protein
VILFYILELDPDHLHKVKNCPTLIPNRSREVVGCSQYLSREGKLGPTYLPPLKGALYFYYLIPMVTATKSVHQQQRLKRATRNYCRGIFLFLWVAAIGCAQLMMSMSGKIPSGCRSRRPCSGVARNLRS